MTGLALNVAIGLQVFLGALTTAISAATSGRQLHRIRRELEGSNEPELSIIRVKDLDQFIRECQAFNMDFGHLDGHEHDGRLDSFRSRFEELLGNGNGYSPFPILVNSYNDPPP
ncbi:hypothetical protein BT96DRAFT_938725 [Gymnopus androsaceus JB14]|uniref:SMODS and SLOG-associating 2TM effector domain-containing protein n=1 Tax=Gymnopus androsaceus JB14 TaxID=1447944 RepID=A0A6A4HRM0_9AGAR|nr:hypothetical protein BT96DRAFT_938725 [Gymnopus androsaceus JB14]